MPLLVCVICTLHTVALCALGVDLTGIGAKINLYTHAPGWNRIYLESCSEKSRLELCWEIGRYDTTTLKPA